MKRRFSVIGTACSPPRAGSRGPRLPQEDADVPRVGARRAVPLGRRRYRTPQPPVAWRFRCAASAAALPGTWSAPARTVPSRLTGLTKVVSTAAWAPCHSGRPFASTSMRRESASGTSKFMSRRRTLVATRAAFTADPGGCSFKRRAAWAQNACCGAL